MSCSSLACGSISRFTNSSTSFASFRCSGVKKGSVSIIILRQLLIWPLAFGLRSLAFGLRSRPEAGFKSGKDRRARPKAKDRRPKTEGQKPSLKSRFPLLNKRLVGFAIIRVLHTNSLSERLRFQCCIETAEELTVQHLFRLRQSERRTLCQSFGKFARCTC